MPAPDKTKEGNKFTCKFNTTNYKDIHFDIQTHD